MLQRIYETRVLREPGRDALLCACAELYGRAKRTLLARLCAGAPLAPLKRAFLVRFGLTARQFKALAAEVRGAIAGIKERRPKLTASLERRIARASGDSLVSIFFGNNPRIAHAFGCRSIVLAMESSALGSSQAETGRWPRNAVLHRSAPSFPRNC